MRKRYDPNTYTINLFGHAYVIVAIHAMRAVLAAALRHVREHYGTRGERPDTLRRNDDGTFQRVRANSAGQYTVGNLTRGVPKHFDAAHYIRHNGANVGRPAMDVETLQRNLRSRMQRMRRIVMRYAPTYAYTCDLLDALGAPITTFSFTANDADVNSTRRASSIAATLGVEWDSIAICPASSWYAYGDVPTYGDATCNGCGNDYASAECCHCDR